MKIGVYAIRYDGSDRVYIGSSKNVQRRWHYHKFQLRAGSHHSFILQRAWDAHGEASFRFSMLEECAVADLIAREQAWIDRHASVSRSLLMNVCMQAGSTAGRETRDETRIKCGAAFRGRRHTVESKRKMSASRAGNKNALGSQHSPESLARRADILKGKPRSSETREKIGKSQIGKIIPDEQRRKISAKLTGRKLPPRAAEHSARISASLKAYYAKTSIEIIAP